MKQKAAPEQEVIDLGADICQLLTFYRIGALFADPESRAIHFMHYTFVYRAATARLDLVQESAHRSRSCHLSARSFASFVLQPLYHVVRSSARIQSPLQTCSVNHNCGGLAQLRHR